MNKAEERALEKYPKAIKDIGGMVIDIGHPQYMRDLYIEGYHQAEKDTIEKVAEWLKNNLEGVVGGSIYIEDFLKAMRDE